MNNLRLILLVYSLLVLTACAGTGGSRPNTLSRDFAVIAWNDLGMHCMDGDYSVFSLLPPYNGWIDLPSCQHCHYRSPTTGNYVRDTSVFDSSENLKQVSGIFTTGSNLYKDSTGHGGIQCEACHGSTHAEYPTSEANDNVQSRYLQGYEGTLAECSVCHADIPLTRDKGPHGMHTTGEVWVHRHESFAEENVAACAVCHGAEYRGTFLSGTSTRRSFRTEKFGVKSYQKRTQVSCYDCHNGPHEDH